MAWVLEIFTESGLRLPAPRNGWSNMRCPFCDDRSDHLGINMTSGVCTCWRCGSHSLYSVLLELGGLSPSQAVELLKRFRPSSISREGSAESRAYKPLRIPKRTPLKRMHRDYLESRGYSSDSLVAFWNLEAFTNIGRHKMGIFIPVTRMGKVVAFQSRLCMDGHERRYVSSSPDIEGGIPIKDCLYGEDFLKDDMAVVVEGPADVWRLGYGSVCSCGTEVTPKQVGRLARLERRYILFDNEESAQMRAWSLAEMLSGFPGKTELILPSQFGVKDSGSMSDDVARGMMRELGFRKPTISNNKRGKWTE